MTVVSGSTASSLVLTTGLATLTMSGGESFTVRDTSGANTIEVHRTDISQQSGLTITCNASSTVVLFNAAGTYTFKPTTQNPQTNCPGGGGGGVSSTASSQASQQSQPQQQTTKPADTTKQPEVKVPEGEKQVTAPLVPKIANVVKDLQKLVKGNKKAISASQNASFGLAVASLNTHLTALNVTGELKADLKATPKLLLAFSKKVDVLEKKQAAVARVETDAAKEADDVVKASGVVKQLKALFKGGLTDAEVKQVASLLKSVGLKAKVTKKSKSSTLLKSANKHVTLQTKEAKDAAKFLPARKKAAEKALATALKNVQKSLTKLNK